MHKNILEIVPNTPDNMMLCPKIRFDQDILGFCEIFKFYQ